MEADFYVASTTGLSGLAGRFGNGSGYLVVYNAGNWQLYLKNPGISLLAQAAASVTVGQTYHLKLSIRNGVKTFYVDNVSVLSSTDNSVTGIGKPGVYLEGVMTDTTGLQLDYFVATNAPIISSANRIRSNVNSPVLYYASGTPLSAEYDVEADLFVASLGGVTGLAGRDFVGDGLYYVL